MAVVTDEMRTQVTENYIGLFGRAPDADGLGYWVQQMAGGTTIQQIAQDMYNTDPARSYYPLFFTPEEIITSFYWNVLGRTPDAEGLAYWTGRLLATDGGTTIREMITAVVDYDGEDAVALDAQSLFNNKVNVGEYYAVVLQGGVVYATSVLEGITPETDTSTPEAIEAFIAGNVTVPGELFTLTTAVDTLFGTNGNDTFIGLDEDSSTNTLTLGDTLNGGGGTDTLKVFSENDDLSLAKVSVTSVENLLVVNSLNDWDDIDIAHKDFMSIVLDVGGQSSGGLYVDNVLSTSAVTLTNIEADDESNYIYFDTDSTSTEGNINVTVSDVDMSTDYEYFYTYAYFTEAETVHSTINLIDIDDAGNGDDGYFDYELDLGDVEDVTVHTIFNIENVRNDDYFEVEYYVYQEGGSTNNLTINITNSDNIYSWFYSDDNGNGTSGDDVATVNLDGVENSNEETEIGMSDFETLIVNVLGDSTIDYIGSYYNGDGEDMGDTTVTLNALADLTVENYWDLNDSSGDTENTLFTITGSGNVKIMDLDDGSSNVTVDGSTATGDIYLGDLESEVVEVTTGTGDDTMEMGDAFELNADLDAFDVVLSAGAGHDTFMISLANAIASEALLNNDVEDFSDAIIDFERLSLTAVGAGALDATKWGLGDDVQIDGSGAFELTVNDEAMVEITGDANPLTVVVDGADNVGSDSDSLTLILNGTDGIAVTAEVADVETIEVESSASKPDKDNPGDNTLALTADEAETLEISGETTLDMTGSSLAGVTKVDAGDFDAGLTIDVSSSGEKVTITTGDGADVVVGSAQNDTISVGDGGNTVTGGLGLDTINLGDGVTEDDFDTIVYTAAAESQGVTVDVINGFQVDVESSDDINGDDKVDEDDLINDVLDFTGAGLLGAASYVGEANGYGAVLTSLTGGGNAEAVLDYSTSTLYVDADGSGTLDADDFAIQLTGVTELSDENFAFV